jgi:hypothetical protein
MEKEAKKKVKRKSTARKKVTKRDCQVPTARQIKMVELLINPDDRRPREVKCAEVGVTRKTLWEWEQNPEFIKYKNAQLEKYTDAQLDEVWKAHFRAIKTGSVEAIKLYHQLKGNFIEKNKTELSTPNGIQVETKQSDDQFFANLRAQCGSDEEYLNALKMIHAAQGDKK